MRPEDRSEHQRDEEIAVEADHPNGEKDRHFSREKV